MLVIVALYSGVVLSIPEPTQTSAYHLADTELVNVQVAGSADATLRKSWCRIEPEGAFCGPAIDVQPAGGVIVPD
jgi:hypothetical protein